MSLAAHRLAKVLLLAAVALWALPAAAQQKKKLEVPAPETLTLDAKDGVQIRCTYYPGGVVEKSAQDAEYEAKPGKEVVPIIMLHDWDGQRGDYDFLASFLQRRGHAVVVPDLRGHGDSTTAVGTNRELDRSKFRTPDLAAMVLDVEAIKKFLLDKNNAGEVNIELLCVVGAGLGSTVALNWAMHDWSWPQLPSFKQGRDVKALVLLSPQQSVKGLNANTALQHPAVRSMAMMIVAGTRDRDGSRDAKAIHNRVERFHAEVTDPNEIKDKKDLFLIEPDTSLSGTKLVDPRARLPVFQHIDLFIQWRLVNKADTFSWTERKSPL